VDRRAFIAGALGVFAAPLVVEAQPTGKVPRIGYLTGNLATVATCERPSVEDCVTSVTSRAATS
jgi:hypothetical protein